MNKLKEVLNKVLNIEFIKYVFVGAGTQAVDLVTYAILVQMGVPYLIADFINNPAVLGFNYLGHKYITFNTKQFSKKEIGKFAINVLINYLYISALLVILISVLNVNEVVSKILTILLIPLINYVLLKRFVFTAKVA